MQEQKFGIDINLNYYEVLHDKQLFESFPLQVIHFGKQL